MTENIHVTEMQTVKATYFKPFNRMPFLFLDELIELSADGRVSSIDLTV